MASNEDDTFSQLSKRGQHAHKYYDFLLTYFNAASQNQFDPETNPDGIVNFGASVNQLMQEEVEERMRREDMFLFSSKSHQHYFDFSGKLTLRTAVAGFFNRYFNVVNRIQAEDLVIMNGSTSCLDALAHVLFDPDDIYLTPTPTYARIFTDFNDRSQVTLVEIELLEEPDLEGITFQLTPELLEKKIQDLAEEEQVVKGFVLINPQNPMGDIYSPILIRRLLEVCAKYKLHVIIDEVYILTMCGSENATSVMAFTSVPDPTRTHVVWSLSKDLSLAGFRLGVVWTKNSAVRKVLQNFGIYNSSASIIQDCTAVLLNDYQWFDEIYFPSCRKRLEEKYTYVVEKLRAIGAVIRPSKAGLFVWFHLKKYLIEATPEGEMNLFDELFEAGVYIVPGTQMYCKSPGWFRMVYSVSDVEINKGIEVMNKILKRRQRILEGNKNLRISHL